MAPLETPTDKPVAVRPIPPAPTPFTFSIDTVEHMNGTLVLLRFMTSVGVNVFFLPPDRAEVLAGLIADKARLARSGLTVATEVPAAPSSNGG